jgi:hypothetical protein
MAEAVYGIVGDGEVSKEFLNDTLDALYDKASMNELDFWLILPYTPAGVTNSIGDVYEWAEANDLYVRAYSDGEEDEADLPAAEEFIVVKRGSPLQRIVKDLVESEGGELLVILHTTDPDRPDKRDAAVNEAIEAANQNGVVVRQLNNGMMELDFTAAPEESSDAEDPSEDDVRQLGEKADEGDNDAAVALENLGKEYSLDVADEPYASMSWTDFAEAILTSDAEKANAEEQDVPEDKKPQSYTRAELEKKQLRQLRAIAVGEGWGKPNQSFPAWFLIDHIVNGTVPTEDQLTGKEDVPKERPGGGAKGRATKNMADSGLLLVASHLAAAAQSLRNYAESQ